MPANKPLTSVRQLPDCITIKRNEGSGLWELRIKNLFFGNFSSLEGALENYNKEIYPRRELLGLDLTPKIIEEAEVLSPKTFMQRLLSWLSK